MPKTSTATTLNWWTMSRVCKIRFNYCRLSSVSYRSRLSHLLHGRCQAWAQSRRRDQGKIYREVVINSAHQRAVLNSILARSSHHVWNSRCRPVITVRMRDSASLTWMIQTIRTSTVHSASRHTMDLCFKTMKTAGRMSRDSEVVPRLVNSSLSTRYTRSRTKSRMVSTTPSQSTTSLTPCNKHRTNKKWKVKKKKKICRCLAPSWKRRRREGNRIVVLGWAGRSRRRLRHWIGFKRIDIVMRILSQKHTTRRILLTTNVWQKEASTNTSMPPTDTDHDLLMATVTRRTSSQLTWANDTVDPTQVDLVTPREEAEVTTPTLKAQARATAR